MHEKYAKDGLVVVSVALDEPGDAESRARGLKFLQKVGAAFPNFLLDEETDLWQTKLKIGGPPLIFVFNRENKIVLKTGETGAVDLALVDKAIEELMKK